MRYGWRARIGHIAPAILDTSGEEMRKLLPAGVLHVGLTISEPILEVSGFKVTATKGLGLTKNIDFASQSPDAAFTLAYGVAKTHPEADAIYIACPRWPSVDIIAALEADTGKAVVAAPAAMVWCALTALRIYDCKPGFGRLMESLRDGSATVCAV